MSGKQHHLIPQLHLNYFTGLNPQGHVWTYDKQQGTCRHSIPKETATVRDFYSMQMADGSINTAIDDFITDIENKAAPIYRDLLVGKIPTGQQKIDFSTFLALMRVRTLGARRMAAELYALHLTMLTHTTAAHPEAFKTHLKKYEEDTGKALDEKQKEKLRQTMLDPSGYVLQVPKEQTFKVIAGAEEMQKIFLNMHWSVGEAQNGFFITSDEPLSHRVQRDTGHPIYGTGGFYNKTSQVTFPLSSKRLLVLLWEPGALQDFIFPIPREFVDAENVYRASNAEQYLYAHMEHGSISKLARRFKDRQPKVESSFNRAKFARVEVPRKWIKESK